jgi:Na+/H+ antiporter NhaA
LPIAAAVGGMAVPALIYVSLVPPEIGFSRDNCK